MKIKTIIKKLCHKYMGSYHYRAMKRIQDNSSCGVSLLREISSRYYLHERKLYYHIDKLKEYYEKG